MIGKAYRGFDWRSLALTGVAALMASAVLAFSRPVVMLVDGQRIESDVSPVTTASDKVFVPVRSIADALGAVTEYDARTGRVEISRGGERLTVRIGSVHATLNGMPMTLRHAPFRVRGRVMIALHVVARAFGVEASYDPRSARIMVNTPGIGEAPNPSGTPALPQ
jgi:hypothetical protein